jgi:hypothetical protein
MFNGQLALEENLALSWAYWGTSFPQLMGFVGGRGVLDISEYRAKRTRKCLFTFSRIKYPFLCSKLCFQKIFRARNDIFAKITNNCKISNNKKVCEKNISHFSKTHAFHHKNNEKIFSEYGLFTSQSELLQIAAEANLTRSLRLDLCKVRVSKVSSRPFF